MRVRNASRVERSANFIFVLFVHFVVFFLIFNTTKYLDWNRPQPNMEKNLNHGNHGKKSRRAG